MRLNEEAMKMEPVPNFGEKEIPMTGTMDVTMQSAANDSIRSRKEMKKRFAEQEKNVNAFVKDNHNREKKNKVSSPATKKLHLSEDVFTESPVMDKPAGRELFYHKKREPLADILQMELTDGEDAYLVRNGKPIPTTAPGLGLDYTDVGIEFEDDGDVIQAWVPDEGTLNQAVDIAKKYGRRYTTGHSDYVKGNNQYIKIYLEPEDWSEPYFDPNAKVFSSKKPKA